MGGEKDKEEKSLNKEDISCNNMVSEEYLSLTFLALASVGTIFIAPFFVDGILIFTIVLIALWKKIYEGILTKLRIQHFSTTLIICLIVFLGVTYLFKGRIIFMVLGLFYLGSSFFAFKSHFENIHYSIR